MSELPFRASLDGANVAALGSAPLGVRLMRSKGPMLMPAGKRFGGIAGAWATAAQLMALAEINWSKCRKFFQLNFMSKHSSPHRPNPGQQQSQRKQNLTEMMTRWHLHSQLNFIGIKDTSNKNVNRWAG